VESMSEVAVALVIGGRRSSVMRRKEAKKDEGADMKRCRVEKQKMERVVFLEFICQHHQFWQLVTVPICIVERCV
jgi:hypothetical protein